MRDLVILGTGVHALEMAEIVERVNRVETRWRLLGYLAHDPRDLGKTLNGLPVLGGVKNLPDFPNAELVPDNVWPRTVAVPRERLVSLVDPSTFVSRTARIGRGCVFYPHGYIGLNARVGDYVFCLSGSIINHDDVLGDRTVLASHVTLAGGVTIGPDCYIGQSCSVRQLLHVGEGSTIGMGAVVVRDVPCRSVMAGNPARRLRAVR